MFLFLANTSYLRNNQSMNDVGGMNPFFDMCRKQNFLESLKRSMKTITEVENNILQNYGAPYVRLLSNGQVHATPIPNFSPGIPESPAPQTPSREQLQQHTSEIMRNAILRTKKNTENKKQNN